MSELISGKEALIAVANGEKVEVKRIHDPDWQPALIFGIYITNAVIKINGILNC